MRKEEMSPQQLEQRQTVVSLLTEANWQPTASNRLFDKGQHARTEAYMKFKNESFELGCSYFAADQLLYFGMYEPSGRGLTIAFPIDERLDELVRKIISIQDVISTQTFRDMIRLILRDFPKAYADMDDELIPIILDEGDEAAADTQMEYVTHQEAIRRRSEGRHPPTRQRDEHAICIDKVAGGAK